MTLLAALTVSCSLVAASGGPGDGLASYRQPLGVGPDLTSPLLADLDADGHVDGVMADLRDLSVLGLEIRWNDGAGRLGPIDRVGLPGRIRAVAAADLDADGLVDLVAADPGAGSILLVRQVAPRAFVPTAAFEVDGIVRELVSGDLTGDLTGDGRHDVLVIRFGGGLGLVSADGATASYRELPAVPPGAMATTVAADVDGDGDRDLVAVRSTLDAPVAIARNDGRGTFTAFKASGSPLRGRDVLPIGTDERGNVLLVVSGTERRQIAEVAIDGNGRVIASREIDVPYAPDRLVAAIGPANVRRIVATGVADVVPGPLQVLTWSADDGLAWERVVTGNGDLARDVAAGDVDGNGVDDLLIDGFRNCVLLDRPDGGHGPSIDYGRRRSQPVVADFDFDGDGDIATIDKWSGHGLGDPRVVLLENDGRAGVRRVVELGPGGGVLRLVELDGVPPAELVRVSDAAIDSWRIGPGLTPVRLPSAVPEDFALGNGRTSILTGDVDGDGRTELLLAGSNGFRILFHVPGQGFLRVIDRRRLGSLGADGSTEEDAAIRTLEAVGDVDGDGMDDLLVTVAGSGLAMLRARGQGAFTPPIFLDRTDSVEGSRLLDLTGDGVLDLLLDQWVPGQRFVTTFRRGLGDGTFEGQGAMALPPNTASRDVVAVDHDGDGRLDLLGGRDPFVGERRLGLATGVPGTDYATLVPGGIRLGDGVAVDLDADGDQDLLGTAGGHLIVMLNGGDERVPGDATADRRVDADDLIAVLAAWGPCACPSDLDRDGRVDAADLAIVIAEWGTGDR